MAARRSWSRRALFAVTDRRALGSTLVGLVAFFMLSLATEARTAVVYPWTGVRLAQEPVEAPPVESETVALEPEVSMPEPVEASEPVLVEEPAIVEELAIVEETLASAPEENVAPSPPPPAEPTPSGPEERTTVPVERPVTADPAPEVEVEPQAPPPAPPVDLGPAIAFVEAAESAIAQGQWQTASAALLGVERETAGVQHPELGPEGALRARIDVAHDDVALLQFEENVLAAIQVARGAQESGDYPAAIGALEGLVARADVATGDRARRMIARLDFWQVAATARNLLEACEFERTNLGRTAPCRI